jgi:hypothetical protein
MTIIPKQKLSQKPHKINIYSCNSALIVLSLYSIVYDPKNITRLLLAIIQIILTLLLNLVIYNVNLKGLKIVTMISIVYITANLYIYIKYTIADYFGPLGMFLNVLVLYHTNRYQDVLNRFERSKSMYIKI